MADAATFAAPADPGHDVTALRAALWALVAKQDGRPVCERSTSGIDACFSPGYERTVDARYGDDRACTSCVATRALTGAALPTGPGRHAFE